MKHGLSVLAYILATFVTQALSHFVINADHYAGVAYLRDQPIFALGVLSMVIQGTILSYAYANSIFSRSIRGGVTFAWLFGAFLVSYIALAEAAKYVVPSVGSWLAVELPVGFVQFTVAGVALGLIHRQPSSAPAGASRSRGSELPDRLG